MKRAGAVNTLGLNSVVQILEARHVLAFVKAKASFACSSEILRSKHLRFVGVDLNLQLAISQLIHTFY